MKPRHSSRTLRSFVVLAAVCLAFNALGAQQEKENLKVFDRWVEWSGGERMLIKFLNSRAFEKLDERDREVKGLVTAEQWLGYREKIRGVLSRITGAFPERTPLNARVTGRIQKDGYRIEKVVFESMPGFHVTGCLFLPDRIRGRAPAILNVIGHTDVAFRSDGYQILIYNLVKKGFVVFAIDPPGQGERLQYFDPEAGKSVVGGATAEHSYFGNQCFLAGVSPGRYFAWDGIRAIDYLLTRREVDPARIGVTGISGGGTQTAYISMLDERVKAAAPACYITGFRRLLESIGPQDAEQNLYHAVAEGITHADFLLARAPRPALIAATTRDFFSIQGARESFAELKRAYSFLGDTLDIRIVEDDLGHGYTRATREATYAFFQETLDLPGSPEELELVSVPREELRVTGTGQVSTSFGAESVFSLNRRESVALLDKIGSRRLDPDRHLPVVLREAKRLSGYTDPARYPGSVFRGRYQREGYAVEMHALPGESGYMVPLLLFVPNGDGPHPAVIYLHPEGKEAAAAPGGEIEKLVRRGFAVAAPDPLGIGETGDRSQSSAYAGVLTGRSVAGIRAADLVRVAAFLGGRGDTDCSGLALIAVGETGPAAVHAAAFDPAVRSLALIGAPLSYAQVALERFYKLHAGSMVAGALTAYDLPDLAASLCPRKLIVIDPVDNMLEPAARDTAEKELEFVRKVYASKGAGGAFRLSVGEGGNPVETAAEFLR